MHETVEHEMTKAKGRPKTARNDRTAKIDATVLSLADAIAKAKGITVAEYLSESMKPIVAKDYAKVMEQLRGGKLP